VQKRELIQAHLATLFAYEDWHGLRRFRLRLI
jgi:hypothetical protein